MARARALILGARPQSARADSGRAKIPKGGRFAAAAAALVVSLLAVSGAGGADAQTPKRGGTLVLAAPQPGPLHQEPACLNPLVGPCGGLASNVVPAVLQAPFDIGPGLTWRPRLVSGVMIATKPRITLTYHIRPGATWSDGVPLTSRDFLFTHNAIRKYWPPDNWHRTLVRSVRPLDAKTVRVVLRSRIAGWRILFGPILPQHALRGVDLSKIWTDRIDNPKTSRPIGSGPFLIRGFERGKQLTLVRNPRYWGRHTAYLDRLVFSFQAGADPGVWFRKDGLDVAFGFPPGLVPGLRQERGLEVLTGPGTNWDRFIIRVDRGGHPALELKLVRRALAYGIDRVALTRQLAGYGAGALPRDSAVFPPQSRYYRPNWARYRFSVARARRLLEQAGCRRGTDAVYMCAGERMRLRLVTTGIPGGYRFRVLDLVAAQLRRIGVEVEKSFATGGATTQILASGEFDLVLFGTLSGPDPLAKLFFGCGQVSNSGGYCQRLVTKDLDQAERILDARAQARALNRADAQMASDVPAIPLFHMPQSAAHRKSVRNFSLSLNSQPNLLWNAEDWWLDR